MYMCVVYVYTYIYICIHTHKNTYTHLRISFLDTVRALLIIPSFVSNFFFRTVYHRITPVAVKFVVTG